MYVEVPGHKNKADKIVASLGGQKLRGPLPLDEVPNGMLLVCVVSNVRWEAALVVADKYDHDRATNPDEGRPRTWLLVPAEAVVSNLRAHGKSDRDIALHGIRPEPLTGFVRTLRDQLEEGRAKDLHDIAKGMGYPGGASGSSFENAADLLVLIGDAEAERDWTAAMGKTYRLRRKP